MKRRILLMILGVLWFPATAFSAEMYTLETIERAMSADTFKLESGKEIKLIGVDAPEPEENRDARREAESLGIDVKAYVDMGKAAKEWAASRLEGKKIFLKYDKERQSSRREELVYAFLYDVSKFYGGIVERVRFEDVQFDWYALPERGMYVFINATVVKGGYALPERNPPNLQYADMIEKAYWAGKESGEGLWNVDWDDVECTGEGGKIAEYPGVVYKCCKDLMPIFDQRAGGKCLERPEPGASGFCSPCGNKKCESKYQEDSCNCPEDCR